MNRNKTLIFASCIIGLIAATAYSSRIRHLRDEITQLTEAVPVLTVTRDMKAGEILAAADLQETLVLKERVSLRSIPPEDIKLIVGRRLIHPVPVLDPILWTDFYEGPRLRRPSEGIPSGYRAIALPADEIHTLVHFISPGDTVDIVSTTFEGTGSRLISRPIAEKVAVLAVGQNLEPDGDDIEGNPLSVSLLVKPEVALTILRASQSGEVHFLARGSSPIEGITREESKKMQTGNPGGNGP